jgi:hypothetical protein
MLSINVFRGASEQFESKVGVWRATLIQRTRHLDSIIAMRYASETLSTASTQSGHHCGRDVTGHLKPVVLLAFATSKVIFLVWV